MEASLNLPGLNLTRFEILRSTRASVRNWIEVLEYIAHKDSPRYVNREIVVELRAQHQELTVRTYRDLEFLLFSLHYSKRILGGSDGEVHTIRLLEIAQGIRKRLEEVFTSEEIRRSAPGGFPGLKEILLYLLTIRCKPERAVETGVAQGVSTCFLLEAMQATKSGRLVSIDLPNYDPAGYSYNDGSGKFDSVYTKRSLGPGWLVSNSLKERWDLRLGSSQIELPKLKDDCDLFLHDSAHTYEVMTFEIGWAWSHLTRGGILMVDDIGWNRAFENFSNSAKPSPVVLADRLIGVCVKPPR